MRLVLEQLQSNRFAGSRSRAFMCVNIFALVLCALFFRIWMLGNIPGMNGDEAWWGVQAIQYLQGVPIEFKTSSGTRINPFFLLPLTAFHAIFDGSFVLVRAVAVISGLLVFPLNFLLCRRVFDLKTALVSTLLLAVLPINIIYSRFGWEPSQSVLASLPVMYCALWFAVTCKRAVVAAAATLVCLAVAVLVHPANYFLICFPLLAFLYRVFRHVKLPYKVLGFPVAVACGLLAFGTVAFSFAPAFSQKDIAERLPQLPWTGDWIPFVGNYLRLFSGINSYRFIAGSAEWRSTLPNGQVVDFHLWDALTAALFGAALLFFFLQARRARTPDAPADAANTQPKDNLLLGFIVTSSLFFFVMSGPAEMGVSFERYVLWMVAPGVLLLSRAAVLATDRWPQIRPWSMAGGFLLCWLLLLGFYLQYFHFIKRTGGESEMPFRTAAVEPKLAAAQYIFHRTEPQQQIYVVSSNWFSHWPLTYVARSQGFGPNFHFILGSSVEDMSIAVELDRAMQSGRLYFAELGESQVMQGLRKGLRAGGVEFAEKSFTDYGGKPAVILLQPNASKSQP